MTKFGSKWDRGHFEPVKPDRKSKAYRIRQEEKVRTKNRESLTETETILYEALQGFATDLLRALSAERVVDEAIYARDIMKRLNI